MTAYSYTHSLTRSPIVPQMLVSLLAQACRAEDDAVRVRAIRLVSELSDADWLSAVQKGVSLALPISQMEPEQPLAQALLNAGLAELAQRIFAAEFRHQLAFVTSPLQ